MTKNSKSEIRDQYMREYVEAAGAQKQGIWGKIWRGMMKLDKYLSRLQAQSSWQTPLVMAVLPMTMAASLFVAPAAFLCAVGVGATAACCFMRADVLVRRDALGNITRDIDAGLLSDRFRTDVLDKRAKEIELQRASLPLKGAAVSQFSASTYPADSKPEELLPPMRGVERSHGRNFG